MKITDLLEDIYRAGGEEIEFHLCNIVGATIKLELFNSDGIYLYKLKDNKGNWTNKIILGLCDMKQIEACETRLLNMTEEEKRLDFEERMRKFRLEKNANS